MSTGAPVHDQNGGRGQLFLTAAQVHANHGIVMASMRINAVLDRL